MSTDHFIDQIERSDLPSETVEAASEALAFVQNFHDFLADLGLATADEIDTVELEKAFESFVAEISAASIFLATFRESVTKLKQTAEQAKKDGSPEFIVSGYRKLADRVQKTKEALLG